jgi:hypothetical protein
MDAIVEVDARGVIQLPRDLRAVVKSRTRYVLEMQGETIVLRPITALPFWQTATPQERAEAARQWAAFEHPAALPIPDAALHREQITIREE